MAEDILGGASDTLGGGSGAGALAEEKAAREAADATKQPLDSDLTALAALTTTSFGRALLTLATATTGREALEAASTAALAAEISARETAVAGALPKPSPVPAYTQTFSTAARTHVAAELSTTLTGLLLTELIEQLNTTNKAVNELKKLCNGVVDDMQVVGLAK